MKTLTTIILLITVTISNSQAYLRHKQTAIITNPHYLCLMFEKMDIEKDGVKCSVVARLDLAFLDASIALNLGVFTKRVNDGVYTGAIIGNK